jgi:hypothetical protein
VSWAKDLPRDRSLALVVDLDREAGLPDEAAVLRDAIHDGEKASSLKLSRGSQKYGALRCIR